MTSTTRKVRLIVLGVISAGLLILAWIVTQGALPARHEAAETQTPPVAQAGPAPVPRPDAGSGAAEPTLHEALDAELERAYREALADFVPSYRVAEDERCGFNRGPRYCLRITVPDGLNRPALAANLQHALRDAYARHDREGNTPAAVRVGAYRPDSNLQDFYNAGTANFAPGGVWTDANAAVPVEDWRVCDLDLPESYFAPRSVADPLIPNGARVKLIAHGLYGGKADPGELVEIVAAFAQRDPVIADVPSGTAATVLEGRTSPNNVAKPLNFYRVSLRVKGRQVEGWVIQADVLR